MPKYPTHSPIALEVLEGCRKGNARDQEVFFEHFRKLIMSVCLRYAANREDAQDIFQESFITIFTQVKSLKKSEYLISWMYKIIISKVIRYYRKRLRWEEIGEGTAANLQVAPDYDTGQMLAVEELLEAIQRLPDGYRLVFNLYVMEGYDHKEIAEMLGINETTSRSQLHRAKTWLKKIFQEEFGIQHYEKSI